MWPAANRHGSAALPQSGGLCHNPATCTEAIVSTANEIHDRARELEALLRQARLPAWAERIEHAVAGGSTGGEIVMALNSILTELLEEVSLPDSLRAAAATLRTALTRAQKG